MRPDVLVRRCGRGAASACFDAGADDGAAATCVAEATAVVGADFGGSDLATTAFSAVLGAGATFTGAAGFGCVVDLAGVAAAASTFVGALATASAFTGAVTFVGAAGAGAGCDATVFGVVDCAVTACD
jgi:hypothetical protein